MQNVYRLTEDTKHDMLEQLLEKNKARKEKNTLRCKFKQIWHTQVNI